MLKPANNLLRSALKCFSGAAACAPWLALALAGWLGIGAHAAVAPLTTIEYRIVGTQLEVSPAMVSVPKNIAGSVLVRFSGDTNSAAAVALAKGVYVEATLRGPSFPARRLVGQVNQALSLPALPLVGDYQLDNIRLVDVATGETKMEGMPSSVPVHVFDEVLISKVTSRPLTFNEIKDRGISIDEKNFRAVEFEVGFVLDGKTIPVKFPVVAPAFQQSTEIIPAAELQERLAMADAINSQMDLASLLPKELETARLNIDVRGINFQVVDDGDADLALQIPPIPALLVIPGNIGYLNQFFSVQVFTENSAPPGSGLSAYNILATLKLPPGPDQAASSNYNSPGDDPLRFARIGADKIVQPTQQIFQPGPDRMLGTPDDIGRLQPGDSGQAEFLVEGLQEGLHVMNLDITASLDGLAAGTVRIMGKAAGSVLVRNPKFSLAFSHPRTTRAGEPYDAYVTILNTGASVANLVQVTLASASISGGVLESDATVMLGTIFPGETATAKFRIRAQRTGAISFSNLTTSDDSVVGRFRLSMGIDERGVALSPDTIGMPDYVTNLPPSLVSAGNRVLGQALSVATAPLLPAGIKAIGKSIITTRVLELAEAGQRIQYGEPLARVLPDLLLDWQGARSFNGGFDQIIRETNAGREWRDAVAREMNLAEGGNAVQRLTAHLPDLAGRSEAWSIVAIDSNLGDAHFSAAGAGTNAYAPRYDVPANSSGIWLVDRPGTNQAFDWLIDTNIPAARIIFARLDTNGFARLWSWPVSNLVAGACVHLDLGDTAGSLRVDANCDGVAEQVLTVPPQTVNELAPVVLKVIQDEGVLAGRPTKPCETPYFPRNYGTVLAVLFSKPMQQDLVNLPSAYALDNGNMAGSVQIQPGGRVALLNMRRPVSALRSRMMMVSGIADARGNELMTSSRIVQSSLRSGVALRGRVARADGSPAAGVPVTLTMYDQETGFDCEPFTVRPSQVFTDTNGYFEFDYVMSGVSYSVSATDIGGLTGDALLAILDSAAGDAFDRAKLIELASSPSVQNSLLAAFSVGALPEAIAKAEGLDRALLRDFVGLASPREGTEVPVALRFRGRGVVTGRVVSADGQTPVPRAAVNLYPDPDSRELGRGVLSDSGGGFAFYGVPLGSFSVEAASSAGLMRTISGVLDKPGTTNNLLIVLSSAVVQRTDLAGRIVEADNITPHGNGTVFVGHYIEGIFGGVVAVASADSTGFWTASRIPVGSYDVIAVSFDGKRKGERRDVAASAMTTSQITIALQGLGVVVGRVETAQGDPVANAFVAGGEMVVRTDAAGTFRLAGVPTGNRSISAGVERSLPDEPAKSTPAFNFPRIGEARVNVLPGVDNFAVIRFEPRGSIVGRVIDETATNPVTGINVALPGQGGFRWVPVDAKGQFAFEGIELGEHTFSAPAPPTADTDVSGILDTLASPDSSAGDIQAAIGEAFAIFTGAADPLLNGEGDSFNPLRWGFAKTALTRDREVRNITIQFLGASTIGGKVVNGQGVPIGARVRLTGIGPARNGAPSTVIRGERNSDPALGTFLFDHQALIGDWGIQVASPFFPVVLMASGQTSVLQPDATNLVLQFPATREVNGRLAGNVQNPDGSLAGPGVKVSIKAIDLEITTVTNGFYDTQNPLPALDSDGRPGKGYFVEALDPVSGARGAATVIVLPGITNMLTVRLLGRGALRVTVMQNDNSPAGGARVGFSQGSYPNDSGELAANGSGSVLFQNLFEGSYGVAADFITGPTTLHGGKGATVTRGKTNDLTIVLGPTGTIQGRFVLRDQVTPVAFAQVAVGATGFTTTDTNGFFSVSGLPLASYRLTSHDPVTGVAALLTTTLTFNGQTNTVTLVEQSLGEIKGAVIDSDGISLAPGVNVTLLPQDGINPSRMVTTGPDGRFSFPGAPAGPFNLEAEHPITHLRGQNSGVLPENAATYDINVSIQPLGGADILVLQTDGSPATNANIIVAGSGKPRNSGVDGSGRAHFGELPLDSYTVTASSLAVADSHSVARTNFTVSAAGQITSLSLKLPGVGVVGGRVFLSDGATPAANAEVTLDEQTPLVRDTIKIIAGLNGEFAFPNVAVGPYVVSARVGPLGARTQGDISGSGEVDSVNVTVEASGVIDGRLVRADGITPVVGEDVTLAFPGRPLPGAIFRTGTNGLFEFSSVPLGNFEVQLIAIGFNGIARVDSSLGANGETNNLGNVRMDEDDPFVVQVTPPNTAVGVPITSAVDLLFNEKLASNSVFAGGVYLQGPSNAIPATLQLLNDTNGVPRLVRMTPASPLKSLTTYQGVVINGARKDALGAIVGQGPTDLVGRPLVAPFVTSFTTADSDPPMLVSISPKNGEIQVDPRQVPRLTFNEPVRGNNFSLTLTGPGGPVAGAGSAGLNGLVLTFTPTAALPINTVLTLVASNIFDLAGNAAAGQPITVSFATLDTIGPTISTLRIANAQAPVAGAVVQIEALLAVNETGASVRFTQDFNDIGADNSAPFMAAARLPASGSTTFRAIATDRFGNDGPSVDFTATVQTNQPPSVSLARAIPFTGPVTNGQPFSLNISATDDVTVTNLTLVGLGAVPFSTNLPNGGLRTFNLIVPSNASPGGLFQFRAQAADALGLKSAEAVLDLELVDGTPPSVAIVSPPANAVLNVEQPLNLNVASSDNSPNITLEVVLSGAISATQTLSVASTPNVSVTNNFNFSLNGIFTDGATIGASVRATDNAGNASTAMRSFVLPDTRPPRLTGVNPTNGASAQSLWPAAWVFDFDEALDPASVTNRIIVTNSAAQPAPFTVAFANSNRQIRVRPGRPLLPGVTYTNTLLPGITDPSSNGWQNAGGQSVPAEGVVFTLATAQVLPSIPANGTPVIAGQSVMAAVKYEAGFGAVFVRFQINANASMDVAAGATNASALITVPVDAVTGVIHVTASPDNSFAEPFAFAPIVLDVRSPTGDEDGDGLPNDFEIAHRLNPFSDDASDDPDHDGLSNLAELTAGTDPQNSDTDGDGIPDGIDPHPLVANHRPVAMPVTFTNANASITITLGGSDADADPLQVRVTALPVIGRIFTTTDGVTPGIGVTNLPAAPSGNPPQVIYRPLGISSTNQLRYVVNDGFTNSIEGVITFVSTNNPAADADGDGIPDLYEAANGLDSFTDDATLDLDGDTLSNLDEFHRGTTANRPDTDNDGLNDGAEVVLGTDPLNPDTDGDGIPDGFDPDPFHPNGDFDGDGIPDTDDPDIDGDGISNVDELALGTDARNPDTDGDRWRDGVEVEAGSDPLSVSSIPQLFHVAGGIVGLLLPTPGTNSDAVNSVTVGQPEVGLTLSVPTDPNAIEMAMTIGRPPIGLTLPSNNEMLDLAAGLTVGQPPVGLVLPTFGTGGSPTDGITVGAPEVGLVLPSTVSSSFDASGLIIGEPVVMLRLDSGAPGPPLGSAIRLQLVAVQPLTGGGAEALRANKAVVSPSAMVILQWAGPTNGTYGVEVSTNLVNWVPTSMEMLSSSNGVFRVRCAVNGSLASFYRLHHAP